MALANGFFKYTLIGRPRGVPSGGLMELKVHLLGFVTRGVEILVRRMTLKWCLAVMVSRIYIGVNFESGNEKCFFQWVEL